MTYEEALAYIASLQPRGWRLGLDRMAEFVRRAGLVRAVDGSERKFIHVAGTNGKGSTTAYLQSILVASGLSTGAFFSPYVLDPGERIQVGQAMLDPGLFAEITLELKKVAEAMEGTEFAGVTEFEFKTGLGFMAWSRTERDWVALETGLGGRLDATNVVSPAVTVIVSIGLDHQSVLGETVEVIAAEKAGIIKSGVPVVLGTMPAEAERVILSVAEANAAPVWRMGQEIEWSQSTRSIRVQEQIFHDVEPGLSGIWQGHNLALAVAALIAAGAPISSESIVRGAAIAHAPGRYQTLLADGETFVLDGAHNADSAVALSHSLSNDFGDDARFVFITNILLGHEIEAFYGPLSRHIQTAIIPPIAFHRARGPAETVATLRALGIEGQVAESVPDALAQARGRSALPTVVTGSFYLVGEVGRYIGAT